MARHESPPPKDVQGVGEIVGDDLAQLSLDLRQVSVDVMPGDRVGEVVLALEALPLLM